VRVRAGRVSSRAIHALQRELWVVRGAEAVRACRRPHRCHGFREAAPRTPRGQRTPAQFPNKAPGKSLRRRRLREGGRPREMPSRRACPADRSGSMTPNRARWHAPFGQEAVVVSHLYRKLAYAFRLINDRCGSEMSRSSIRLAIRTAAGAHGGITCARRGIRQASRAAGTLAPRGCC
jgi:hypothetical protein